MKMHITLLSVHFVLGPWLFTREGWKNREERIEGERDDMKRSEGGGVLK